MLYDLVFLNSSSLTHQHVAASGFERMVPILSVFTKVTDLKYYKDYLYFYYHAALQCQREK
jgi:hypothetical protein